MKNEILERIIDAENAREAELLLSEYLKTSDDLESNFELSELIDTWKFMESCEEDGIKNWENRSQKVTSYLVSEIRKKSHKKNLTSFITNIIEKLSVNFILYFDLHKPGYDLNSRKYLESAILYKLILRSALKFSFIALFCVLILVIIISQTNNQSGYIVENLQNEVTREYETKGKQKLVKFPSATIYMQEETSMTKVADNRFAVKEGNLWFDVNKTGSTFEVMVGDSLVNVKGTSFGVFKSGNDIRIEVVEGLVEFIENTITYEIHPGDVLELKNNKIMPPGEKFCSTVIPDWVNHLNWDANGISKRVQYEIPIGGYTNFNFDSSQNLGLVSISKVIGATKEAFDNPERINAELLYFAESGYLEYDLRLYNELRVSQIKSISVSMEIFSNDVDNLLNDSANSEITLWLNDQEIGTWANTSDFSEKLGYLTPEWWSKNQTAVQHGKIVTWTIKKDQVSINSQKFSNMGLNQIELINTLNLRLKIGVKKDSPNKKGLYLFGSNFGNHSQHILVTLDSL